MQSKSASIGLDTHSPPDHAYKGAHIKLASGLLVEVQGQPTHSERLGWYVRCQEIAAINPDGEVVYFMDPMLASLGQSTPCTGAEARKISPSVTKSSEPEPVADEAQDEAKGQKGLW